MQDIFYTMPEKLKKVVVESMYYSVAEYKEYIRKTITNNGVPHRAKDYINTGLFEISELLGFTCECRKIGFYEYIFLHHTFTDRVYVFVSENSLTKLRGELPKRNYDHYLEGWAFINDQWSTRSVRDQSGNVVMIFDQDDISYTSEKYGKLRDLSNKLLENYTANLCVFVTFTIKRCELIRVKAVIPSSTISSEFLFTEDWSKWIPVLYHHSITEDNIAIEEEEDIELELKNGTLDHDDYELDIEDESESESEG